jgi:uncharacterized membrane protein YhaH (DUF805 family)
MPSTYCTTCGTELHQSALSCPACGNLVQRVRPSPKSWFSFSGRIPRSTYWLQYELPVSLLWIFLTVLGDRIPDSITTSVLFIVLMLAVFWHQLAGTVKRAHDRGHSGWFLLLGFIPLVNIVVGFQLAFLAGDSGPNQYGPDPLGSHAVAVTSQAPS